MTKFFTRVGLVGTLALAPAMAQVTSEITETAVQRWHGPVRDWHDHHDGSSSSTNWSGYAVTGSGFTKAQASWTVPTANCSGVSGSEYSSFWVGLDGFSSSTVEQTGTDSDCNGSRPAYYAWYEFYPHPLTQLSMAVSPGNVMSASVTYSGGKFTVKITNVSTGQTFSKSSSVSGAKRTSAEWITEAPCCTGGGGILPLADYGTVFYGQDNTGVSGTNDATSSSHSGAIGSFPSSSINSITKVSSSTSPQTSTPSSLSGDGSSFSTSWAP